MSSFLKRLERTERTCPFTELQRTRTAALQDYHSALAELENTVVGRKFLAAARTLQTLEQGPPEDPREYIQQVVTAHRSWSKN